MRFELRNRKGKNYKFQPISNFLKKSGLNQIIFFENVSHNNILIINLKQRKEHHAGISPDGGAPCVVGGSDVRLQPQHFFGSKFLSQNNYYL